MSAQVLRGIWGGTLLAILALAPTVRAQSAESKFHRAYYLEQARGEVAAAAKIYDEVAGDRRADAKLKSQARARGDACHEELASADFARLMPSNALAYVELNRPGAQLSQLLKMLGLLREDGSLSADPDRRVAISPALIRELLGVRGAAVALTGFDPAQEMPFGVAILHPGDIDVLRGLIETALPAGARVVEPIEGFPTYCIEDEAFVTLTARLVVVSTQRSEIEGVIWRLKGEEDESLAANPDLAEIMRQRDDSLVFFCVNFKPVMPLLNAGMAAAGTQCSELAMAQALLDLKSLRSLVGQMGVNDEGLYLDVALRLEQGHRNLLFHFLRMPAIDRETLKRVPSGAAGFFAAALNDVDEQGPKRSTGEESPPVTMLDIGREIFANIASVAVFAVPSDAEVSAGGPPIPPVAAVFTVNDPQKSLALWNQALGIGSLASGAGSLDGMVVEIDGVEARRFVFPDGISIYLAHAGRDILISPHKAAISRSIATQRSGESILDDPAFSKNLARLGPDATFALFAHPGRCAKLAQPFLSPGEVQEMQPVVELLTDTVASLVMEHSNHTFHFSTMVTGLPDVGPFVSKMISEEQQRDRMHRRLSQAKASGQWDEALDAVREARADNPDDDTLLWTEFKILATGKSDYEAALKSAERLFEAASDDADRLNQYAWALLTEEDRFEGRYDELALKLSKRSNELSDHQNWYYVDTLALAMFKTGDARGAVETGQKALALCGSDSRRSEVEDALKRFEAAVEQ